MTPVTSGEMCGGGDIPRKSSESKLFHPPELIRRSARGICDLRHADGVIPEKSVSPMEFSSCLCRRIPTGDRGSGISGLMAFRSPLQQQERNRAASRMTIRRGIIRTEIFCPQLRHRIPIVHELSHQRPPLRPQMQARSDRGFRRATGSRCTRNPYRRPWQLCVRLCGWRD